MTVSERWADYAVSLRFEDIPPTAVMAAKMFFTDAMGCALGGARTKDFRMLCSVIKDLGGKPECTVIGAKLRADVRHASLANALAIRALDYNDVYWKQDPCHPSDLLPAALSVAEREGRSGKDLLAAMVIAYELDMRISEAAFPGIRELGWHHASLTQFVSPVVAGRVLGLTREQMVNAIGISGSHNGTLGAVAAGRLTMMKNSVNPMATESGVMAALMAQKGYEAPAAIFEGREGLFESLGEEWDASRLTRDLGSACKIVDCSLKPFPSEALTHSPISATLDLVTSFDLCPEQVEQIEVETLRRGVEILSDRSKYEISSRETADHSLPYCIAAALVDRAVTPRQFEQNKLSDPRILAMVPKVSAKVNEDFERRFPAEQPCRVTVRLAGGRVLQKERAYPKGDPRDPLTAEELRSKFRNLAGDMDTDPIFDTIDNLELLPNIAALVELFGKEQ
jgi:2-methylcitrate dehydratase